MPKTTRSTLSRRPTAERMTTRASAARDNHENLNVSSGTISIPTTSSSRKRSPLSARGERRLNRETQLHGLAEDPEIGASWKAANPETASIEDMREENVRLEKKVTKLKDKIRMVRAQLEDAQRQLRIMGEEREETKKALEGTQDTLMKTLLTSEEYRQNLVDAQAELERLFEEQETGQYPMGYGQEPSRRLPILKARSN